MLKKMEYGLLQLLVVPPQEDSQFGFIHELSGKAVEKEIPGLKALMQ